MCGRSKKGELEGLCAFWHLCLLIFVASANHHICPILFSSLAQQWEQIESAVLCCLAPKNSIQRRALGPKSGNRRLERAHLASELAREAEVPMQDACSEDKRMSRHRCVSVKCLSYLAGWVSFGSHRSESQFIRAEEVW